MKWFRKDRNVRPDPADHEDGPKAVQDANERLKEVQDQWPEVYRVSSSLRDMRKRNHFGEAIARIMGEQTP
jgi:hypothetical protein